MTKTMCDLSGTVPASNYRIVKQDGSTMLSLDMCDACAEKVMEHIRQQRKISDVQAVMEAPAVPAVPKIV